MGCKWSPRQGKFKGNSYNNKSIWWNKVGIINNAILDIKNSIVKGSGIGIFNSGVANIVVSQVVGKIDNRGSIKCFNVYDANYDLFLCQ